MMDRTTIIINNGGCCCHKPKPRLRVTGVQEIPRKKECQTMVATGNHFWDKVLLQLTVTPDGALDGPVVWTSDNPGLTLTASVPDGLTCTVQADADTAAFQVTATAPADNPSTPELESVSESFTGSFSHSKATALSGAFTEVPRT